MIDTTNFTDKRTTGAPTRNLPGRLFTRTAPDTLLYEFTVDDPTAFTKPWKVELPMMQSEGPMYEFACHEGNRAMMNMLNTARIQKKAAAEKAAARRVTRNRIGEIYVCEALDRGVFIPELTRARCPPSRRDSKQRR